MGNRTSTSGAIKRLDSLYEFDRAPVSENRLCGGGYFAGSFAGEHVAATEFVIGALFVTWGASVMDVVVGLAIGNLLAVLSWALVCAPIAVETRMTLYWYLRKIGGPVLTLIYNVLNAVLFCILAGCMITVSASAVRLLFDQIPRQTEWYPTHWGFVLVVLLVGAVVVVLAIAGFKRLATFASVCAPWMLIMFLAGFLVMLPRLGAETGVGPVNSLARFWEMGQKAVWTGRVPGGGPPEIGFWHVAAFAWICNLAMHMGLSDMALFRYARHSAYGLFSFFGMFLGHYLAWIWAGVMGAGAALILDTPLTELDSGAVAYSVLGVAGAVAVVIAGWTTSNPTLYRAGLALQAVTPNWPRWAVTLVAGTITTVIACFPFVFKELLNFVGLYGLLLVPAGAIVVTEHWIFPRIGLKRYWSSSLGQSLNWPALVAWASGMALALGLWLTDTVHLFFLFLPVYILTVFVYIALAAVAGARKSEFDEGKNHRDRVEDLTGGDTSRPAASVPSSTASARWQSLSVSRVSCLLALAALGACIAMPCIVYFTDYSSYQESMVWFKKWLIAPTLVYFLAGTVWQITRKKARAAQ